MKHFYGTLPGALLLSYLVYTTFVPITIAHSLILIALAGLFGYSTFLYSQKTPSINQELKNLKESLEQKLKQHEEIHEERLSKVENVASAIALSSTKVTSSSSFKPQTKKEILF